MPHNDQTRKLARDIAGNQSLLDLLMGSHTTLGWNVFMDALNKITPDELKKLKDLYSNVVLAIK